MSTPLAKSAFDARALGELGPLVVSVEKRARRIIPRECRDGRLELAADKAQLARVAHAEELKEARAAGVLRVEDGEDVVRSRPAREVDADEGEAGEGHSRRGE